MPLELVAEEGSPIEMFSERTDFANALYFAKMHQGKILYDPQLQQWFEFDGKRFSAVPAGVIRGKYVEDFILALIGAAAEEPDPALAAEKSDWAEECQGFYKLKAIVERAADCGALSAKTDTFDADPYALNVQNGVIDLRTGELRARMGADRFTVVSPTAFGTNAKCPMFEKFIDSTLPDPEVRAFMRRSLGYFLTGLVSEQNIWFILGRGGTGKSTLFLIISNILGVGEHVHFTDPNFLSERSNEKHLTELMSLKGKRLVVCPELPARRAFNEARIKTLTGGEPITANKMRQDEVTFSPTHKLVAYANHTPRLLTGGDSLTRRLLLVPFDTKVDPNTLDKNLCAKISEHEAEGVLGWLVRACLEWQKEGLNPPESMKAGVAEYINDESPFSDFFSEKLEFNNHTETEFYRIYQTYTVWCREMSMAPESQVRVKQELVAAGAIKMVDKDKRARLKYKGVVLFP